MPAPQRMQGNAARNLGTSFFPRLVQVTRSAKSLQVRELVAAAVNSPDDVIDVMVARVPAGLAASDAAVPVAVEGREPHLEPPRRALRPAVVPDRLEAPAVETLAADHPAPPAASSELYSAPWNLRMLTGPSPEGARGRSSLSGSPARRRAWGVMTNSSRR